MHTTENCIKNIVIFDKIGQETTSISTDSRNESAATSIFGFVTNAVNEDESETEIYFREKLLPLHECPLAYWANNSVKYPKLSLHARRYLSIPASSGAIERVFSSGGKIFRPERCNLSNELFSSLIFIKCNKKLLE